MKGRDKGGPGMQQHECVWSWWWRGEGDVLMKRRKVVGGVYLQKIKKAFEWKKNKTKQTVVSTQDEAGLATRWVSPSTCGGVGTSRRGRGLLLLLVLMLSLCIIREIYGWNKDITWLFSVVCMKLMTQRSALLLQSHNKAVFSGQTNQSRQLTLKYPRQYGPMQA